MKRDLIIKKCLICGAVIEVLNDCNCKCGIQCCSKEMKTVVANSVDAAFEKHVPTYIVEGDKITVKVNHVMEEEHYIEWIAMVKENSVCKKFFNPGEVAEITFKYVPGSKVYSYCNKHELWSIEIK